MDVPSYIVRPHSNLRTAQKIKFSIKNFHSKSDQTCETLRIWPHLLKRSLIENVYTGLVIKKKIARTTTLFGRNSELVFSVRLKFSI